MSTEVMMKGIRPCGQRVTVLESPVDAEQLESGIIVPHTAERGDFSRGVVLDVGWVDAELLSGVVVYYRRGTKIGDVTVVERDDVIAFEAPDG